MSTTHTKFRKLMGRFATGITVIALENEEQQISAMTANAVTAVSLDPMLLLCCFRNESRLLSSLLNQGRFSVNILSAGQDAICRHYGGQQQAISPAVWKSIQSVPLLEGANASFICTVHSTYKAGDHTVVFGAVEDMTAIEQPAPALVFAAGRYHDIALAMQ